MEVCLNYNCEPYIFLFGENAINLKRYPSNFVTSVAHVNDVVLLLGRSVACIKVKVPISPEVIYYKSHPRFLDHLLLCCVRDQQLYFHHHTSSRVTKVFFGFGGRGKRVFSEPFASGSNKAC